MIYELPSSDVPLDQADLIEQCPLVRIQGLVFDRPANSDVVVDFETVIVLTQTCDLAQLKTER